MNPNDVAGLQASINANTKAMLSNINTPYSGGFGRALEGLKEKPLVVSITPRITKIDNGYLVESGQVISYAADLVTVGERVVALLAAAELDKV